MPVSDQTASSLRSEVRRAGRAARHAVAGIDRTRRERALVSHLLSLEVLREPAAVVGVFIADDGEPDLAPLVHELRACGITIALPMVGGPDEPAGSMWFVPWHEGDALAPGRYGIPVPPASAHVVPDTLLVSFVGFDQRGQRMGRGGGYFDRYLAQHDAQTTAIGVGFETQRFETIPAEPHDRTLATVVTDLGIRWQCSTSDAAIGKDGALCR